MITQSHQQTIPGWTAPDTFPLSVSTAGVDITVSWTYLSGLTYDIYTSTTGIEYTPAATGITSGSRTLTGQSPNTTYHIYAVARNNTSGFTSQSSISVITTPTALSPPSLSFSSATTTTLRFTWATIPTAASYTFSYSANPALLGTDQAFSKTVSNESTGLTGLPNNTTYYVVIRANASNAVFNSGWSNIVIARTLQPVPSTPSGFAATPTPSGIVLTWTDVATETGYRLYRSTTNNQSTAPFLIELSQDTVTFTDTTVYSNTRYYYWLQSYHLDGSSGFVAANATSYRIPLREVKPISCTHPVVIDDNLSTYVQTDTTTEITFTFANPELIGRFGFLIQTNATTSFVNCRFTTPGNAILTSTHDIGNGNTLNESSAIQLSYTLSNMIRYVIPVQSVTLTFIHYGSITPRVFSIFEVKFFGYPKQNFDNIINSHKSDTHLAYTFQDILPTHVETGHFDRTPFGFAIKSASYTHPYSWDNSYDVSLILSSEAESMKVYSTLEEAQSKIDADLPTFVPFISWSQVNLGAEFFILLRVGNRYSIYKYRLNLNRPTELTLIEHRTNTATPLYSAPSELSATNPIILDHLLPDNHYYLRFSDRSLTSF